MGCLALAVLALVILLCAPLSTVTIRVDLPPADAAPMSGSDWLVFLAWVCGGLVVVPLIIGVPIWLVIRTARRIILAQPEADP